VNNVSEGSLKLVFAHRSMKDYTIFSSEGNYQDTTVDMSDFGFTHYSKKKRFSYVFQEAVD
jgi:hypothetical protein|tara:strand:- start:18 stop:200 length:183 start_codon:yes stop_codon:yes gene_type:complete